MKNGAAKYATTSLNAALIAGLKKEDVAVWAGDKRDVRWFCRWYIDDDAEYLLNAPADDNIAAEIIFAFTES